MWGRIPCHTFYMGNNTIFFPVHFTNQCLLSPVIWNATSIVIQSSITAWIYFWEFWKFVSWSILVMTPHGLNCGSFIMRLQSTLSVLFSLTCPGYSGSLTLLYNHLAKVHDKLCLDTDQNYIAYNQWRSIRGEWQVNHIKSFCLLNRAPLPALNKCS